MRHLWLLGLWFIIACSGSAPTDGSVFVLLTYGSYTPACLRIIASDGPRHKGQADIPKEQFHYTEKGQVRAAVYRNPDWGRDLSIEVSSWDATAVIDKEIRCSGNKLETLDTPERIRVPEKDFATFAATLQARDDDGDKHVLKTQDVAGTDCDDTNALIHPEAEETCGGKIDFDCDGLTGCAETDCVGQSCDDGNACTDPDTCVAVGGATPQCRGVPKKCDPPNLRCYSSESSCDPATGQCLYSQRATDTECNDGDWCTSSDRCTNSGVCQGERFDPCESPGECKIAVSNCSESSQCTVQPDPQKVGEPCSGVGAGGKCRSDGVCSVFPYSPSNFNSEAVSADDRSLDVLINCGSLMDPVIFNSTSGRWKFPAGCSLTMPVARAPQGNDGIVLLAMRSLTIEANRGLKLIGNRPVILAVYGNARLSGALLANANGDIPGAGGNRLSCLRQEGGTGFSAQEGGSGGGGGGFGEPGAAGGRFNDNTSEGSAGAKGDSTLMPLIGGCPGGMGGSAPSSTNGGMGGAGGGALQLSVAGTLMVEHWISVSGGGGQGGKGTSNGGRDNAGGGGGGGSGGGVLVEAASLQVKASARLTANGGGGAEGGDSTNDNDGTEGVDGAQSSRNPALGGDGGGLGAPGGKGGTDGAEPTKGGDGIRGGAGGGGGGVGVIVLRGSDSCNIHSSCTDPNSVECVISPRAMQICPPSP
jgi:hypothetical protein